MNMSEENIITVLNEDGEKIELQLIDTIEMDENLYALIAPVGDEEDAYVYKIVYDAEGKKHYEVVEDDSEFDRVLEKYEASFDE